MSIANCFKTCVPHSARHTVNLVPQLNLVKFKYAGNTLLVPQTRIVRSANIMFTKEDMLSVMCFFYMNMSYLRKETGNTSRKGTAWEPAPCLAGAEHRAWSLLMKIASTTSTWWT